MSVPFSNTHLRVPQGFGTILEGLAREVLRNQPEDIPKYAAQYFDALLKKREESGTDPAEWAAKLEDRFYNNHAFKTTGQPSPEKETETDLTKSKEKSQESQAEDDLSHSPKDLNHSTTQPNVSEEVSLTEKSEEEEEAETELGISEGESVNRLPVEDVQSDELSATEEEKDPSISKPDEVDREPNENDSSSDMPQSDLESTHVLSLIGILNVDVCAQELGTTEDVGGDEPQTIFVEKEILDSEEEENPEVEEPVEVFPYSGLAGVDVCAAELGGTEKEIERATADSDTHAGEIKFPSEETLVRSSLHRISESNQQEVENKEDKTNPEEGIENEASFEETHEHIAHIEDCLDGIAMPKQDSLDENNFEDNVTTMGQIISGTQDEHDELEKDGNDKEVNSEEEEVESQHEASVIMEEKLDTNVSNLNDSDDDDDDDDEKGEGIKNVSSPHQPTTEADKESPEDETDHRNEDNNMISEGKLHQNDNFEKETLSNDDKEEETTDMVGQDEEGIHAEGYSEMDDDEINDGDAENLSSQAIQSNIVTTAMEKESETFEASAQHLPEENKGSERTLVESQPEDTMEENEFTSKEEEELVEQEAVDSEIQEKSDAVCEEENISLTHSADGTLADHQGEEMPLGSEKDTIEPEGLSSDKQEECSRPQEEEDIMDIPLDDPEANRAAAKIQAGFRGHMTRKKMKPEDKTEGEEVSSTGDVLNGSQGDTETGGSGAVERDDTSVPEQ